MADNPRIEDLRKRYHENPRRFFAPLANEYRKSGLLDRAYQLCQKHVPDQPENMNGLVVFGQTLFEMQQPEAAREPFEQALRLDPENLIALRHLGDIARMLGDVPTAKSWYEKVLELDRRNDEVIDLLAGLGGAEDDTDTLPPARPSTAASSLISVAPTVSVSGGVADLGLVDLSEPSPPKPAAGKGGTVVINAQALADRDRSEAAAPGTPADSGDALGLIEPLAEPDPVPAARPSKRASLLDISFDFSETAAEPAPMPVPEAPVLGAEAAEYGFAEEGVVDPPSDDTLIIETIGDVAPLGLEPTIVEPTSAPEAAAPDEGFELAEFSAEVPPLAGLEATEFTAEQVAPMAELEPDSISMTMPSVSPLADLDRPEISADDVTPVVGLDTAMLELPAEETPIVETPIVETPSARPKPRMTKADLASLPLLADFGLEDDAPTAPASFDPAAPTPVIPQEAVEPPARSAKATPTFVTETMAALYVQQGLIAEAIAVYRQLVEASPADGGLQAKLTELERMQQQEMAKRAPASVTAEPSEEMPDFETPLEAVEPEPAPANAALADVSFGDIGLTGQGNATPVLTPAVPAGPSAREFFGAFARRAAVAAAAPIAVAAAEPLPLESAEEPPTAASASVSGWPLDALFGAAHEVRDLHAAETLAGLGTFPGPDGGSGLGDLLTAPAAPKRAVPRASETLKFDQFFQQPGTVADPAPETAPAPVDDDLDQFQDWLKGLKP